MTDLDLKRIENLLTRIVDLLEHPPNVIEVRSDGVLMRAPDSNRGGGVSFPMGVHERARLAP